MKSCQTCKPRLRAGPTHSSRKQNKLSSSFGNFLSHIALFGHFLKILLVFFLCTMVSGLVFVCVCTCVRTRVHALLILFLSSLLFVYYGLFISLFTCSFSKERERKQARYGVERVGRIWEEMREGKS